MIWSVIRVPTMIPWWGPLYLLSYNLTSDSPGLGTPSLASFAHQTAHSIHSRAS